MKISNYNLPLLCLFLFFGLPSFGQSECYQALFQANKLYEQGYIYEASKQLENIKNCEDPAMYETLRVRLASLYFEQEEFQKCDKVLLELAQNNGTIDLERNSSNADFQVYAAQFDVRQKRYFFHIGEHRFKVYSTHDYFLPDGSNPAKERITEKGSFLSLELGASYQISKSGLMISPLIGMDMIPYEFRGTYYYPPQSGAQQSYEVNQEGQFYWARAGLMLRMNDMKGKFDPNKALASFLRGFYIGGQFYYPFASNTESIGNALEQNLPTEYLSEFYNSFGDRKNYNRQDYFFSATLGYQYNIPLKKKNLMVSLDARYDLLFQSFVESENLLGYSDISFYNSYNNDQNLDLHLHLGVGLQFLTYKIKRDKK